MKLEFNKHEEIIPIAPSIDYYYTLKCRYCGEEDQIIADYTSTNYGKAVVTNRDCELNDYEIYETEDFKITAFKCGNCDREGIELNDLIYSVEELESGGN